MLYILLVFAVVAASILWGFYRRLSRQTADVIGIAFAIICCRLLSPGLTGILYGAFPSVHGTICQTYVYDTASTAIIFTLIYFIFRTATLFLNKIMSRGEHSILDNIGGALFSLFKYLLILSVAYNIIIAGNRNSQLLDYVKSDDGNIIEGELLLAPAVLGGEDVMELSDRIQLEEAKKIS